VNIIYFGQHGEVMAKLTYKLGASKRELQAALRVRREVFVNEQGISPDEEYDGYDGEALHLVVKDRGKVIGTVRLRFVGNKRAKLERMAILKPFRRHGIGREIISFLGEQLANRQVDQLTLHAQYSAIAFYESCGFKALGLPFWDAGIQHIRMDKQL